MKEYLKIYNDKGEYLGIRERGALYSEMQAYVTKYKDTPYSVDCIYLFLFNKKGELYVVQRANKRENPFLFDKTVGGHMQSSESPQDCVCREAKEEIDVDLELCANLEELVQQYTEVNLFQRAIAFKVDRKHWIPSLRIDRGGNEWTARANPYFYLGLYEGELSYPDEEAQDYICMNLRDLKRSMQESPKKYTADLKYLLEEYKDLLKEFLNKIG